MSRTVTVLQPWVDSCLMRTFLLKMSACTRAAMWAGRPHPVLTPSFLCSLSVSSSSGEMSWKHDIYSPPSLLLCFWISLQNQRFSESPVISWHASLTCPSAMVNADTWLPLILFGSFCGSSFVDNTSGNTLSDPSDCSYLFRLRDRSYFRQWDWKMVYTAVWISQKMCCSDYHSHTMLEQLRVNPKSHSLC
jgi:hypothetical protein